MTDALPDSQRLAPLSLSEQEIRRLASILRRLNLSLVEGGCTSRVSVYAHRPGQLLADDKEEVARLTLTPEEMRVMNKVLGARDR